MMKQLDINPVENSIGSIDDLILYNSNGALIPRVIIREAFEFFQDVLKLVESELDLISKSDKNPKLSVGAVFRKNLETHHLYQDLHESHKRLFHWFLADYEAQNLTSFNQTSIETKLKKYQSKSFRIPGGLGQLPHALAFGPGYDPTLEIFCETPIDHVIYQGTGIEVKSAGQSFQGGVCILAIPVNSFRVLRLIGNQIPTKNTACKERSCRFE